MTKMSSTVMAIAATVMNAGALRRSSWIETSTISDAARGRADDNDEVILNRMNVYRDETAPLLEYYRNELKTVDAVGTVDEVFARALRALGK